MQKLRSLTIVTLIFAMVLSFSGCNKDKEKEENTTTAQVSSNVDTTVNTTENTTTKPKDQLTAEDIIDYAIESVSDITSYDLNLDINSGMTFLGLPITFTNTTTGSAFAEPMKMMTKSTAVVRNVSTTNSEAYIETVGDKVYTYSKMNDGEWTKQETSATGDNSSGQVNVLDMISLCLNSIENMDMSSDQVNGASAYKIEGTVTGKSVQNIVSQSGLMNNMSALGGSADTDISGIYEGLSNMYITLWIDENTYYPVQYQMDMTEISSRILEVMKQSGNSENGAILNNVGIKTFDILTTLKNFNNATNFEIPSEAKSS